MQLVTRPLLYIRCDRLNLEVFKSLPPHEPELSPRCIARHSRTHSCRSSPRRINSRMPRRRRHKPSRRRNGSRSHTRARKRLRGRFHAHSGSPPPHTKAPRRHPGAHATFAIPSALALQPQSAGLARRSAAIDVGLVAVFKRIVARVIGLASILCVAALGGIRSIAFIVIVIAVAVRVAAADPQRHRKRDDEDANASSPFDLSLISTSWMTAHIKIN